MNANISLWNEYVLFAVESQFKKLRSSPKERFSELQRDSNPWPLCSRCRPIHWRQANLLSSSTRERNETEWNNVTCRNTNELNMWPSFVFPQFTSFHSIFRYLDWTSLASKRFITIILLHGFTRSSILTSWVANHSQDLIILDCAVPAK